MRALPIEIFKSEFGDCSNGGISSKYKEILVECPDGHIEIDENNPPENLCKIVTEDFGFAVVQHVEPVVRPNGVGWMYGGCIVDTSDSRWSRLKGNYYPLKLHDRCESQELYDTLSR